MEHKEIDDLDIKNLMGSMVQRIVVTFILSQFSDGISLSSNLTFYLYNCEQ